MKFRIAKETIVPKMGSIVPKIFALSVALVLFISISACRVYGQARPSPLENVISVDPLPLAYDGPLVLQYELKAGPVESWLFRVQYWPSPDPSGNWSGFGIGAAYRFFIADSRALTGLSVAPAADIFFFQQTITGESGSQRTAICFDIGGDVAYKWIFDDFAVEPILGLRIGITPNIAPTRASGLEPLIGVSGGYAF